MQNADPLSFFLPVVLSLARLIVFDTVIQLCIIAGEPRGRIINENSIFVIVPYNDGSFFHEVSPSLFLLSYKLT